MSAHEDTGRLIDLTEAARLTGLARATWANGGAGTNAVPRIRFGRAVRVRMSDVEKFITGRILQAERVTRLTSRVEDDEES